MRKRRGYSILAVMAVLLLVALVMNTVLSLVVSHLRQTRRRGDLLYAMQLARSGIDWAVGCLASGQRGCQGTLTLAGGEIGVQIQGGSDLFHVRSEGKVVRDGVTLASRVLVLDYGAPPSPPPETPGTVPDIPDVLPAPTAAESVPESPPPSPSPPWTGLRPR